MGAKSFHVINWETGETISSWTKLAAAKRYCRGQGHTGYDHPFLTGYSPIAYVANDKGDCVYNPHFRKNIGPAVSGLINAQPSGHF